MIKARTALILENPFFGVLALKLKMYEDPTIPSAATNGEYLAYNPDYVNKLNKEQRKGLIAHEVMHCALQHIVRRQYRDPSRFNKACDYAINGNLIKQGFHLPDGGLVNHDWDEFSTEHIYSLLQDEESKNPDNNNDNGEWNFGGVDDALGEGASESELKAKASDWQINVQQAANAAKMQGKLPANLERLFGDILEPQIDWKEMLYKYIHVPVKDDYNWGRANRRFLHSGIVLPTLYNHAMGEVAIIVDTSGSISDTELQLFASEISGICEDAKPSAVHVIYCDAQVHRHDTFTVDEYPITMKTLGGGGTDMKPAFDLIEKFDNVPECIICLTDLELYTHHINQPECDTLWISTGRTDKDVTFGEICKLEL